MVDGSPHTRSLLFRDLIRIHEKTHVACSRSIIHDDSLELVGSLIPFEAERVLIFILLLLVDDPCKVVVLPLV